MSSYIDSRLPYELRALETVLAAVAKTLETEAVDLEKCITPALKRLLNKVSTGMCSGVLCMQRQPGLVPTCEMCDDTLFLPSSNQQVRTGEGVLAARECAQSAAATS